MSQRTKSKNSLSFTSVELGGVAYAIIPAATLATICRQAGITAIPLNAAAPEELSSMNVARRIAERRKHAGLTQGELASRAGVRIETVNRIERGRVTPDFGTIRKLLQAMQILANKTHTTRSPGTHHPTLQR